MRIWLDPEKVAARNLTAGEVVAALQAQNVQVASGVLNQPPTASPGAFQLNVETLGRLADPRQFANIVVRNDPGGRVTRIRDVGRVELGAQDYSANSYLDERQAVPLLIFQRPGSNALATADRIKATIGELARSFPSGLQIRHRLQPDRVHRRIGSRGAEDDLRGRRSSSSSSSSYSCRPGAPRSSRSWRSRSR